MPANAAPRVEYDAAKDNLPSFADLPFLARLARFLDLGPALRRRVRVKQRRRGCRDDETLLALILALCTGGGHLSSVDTLAADTAVCRAAGLRAVPGSRRLGEFLTRLSDPALAGLQECARVVARRLTPAIVRHYVDTQEYVPVFVDGTGIEVQGHHCEGTARGYNGEKQDWLHSVFVGAAWVSARLNEGATDGQGDWREQLETDVAPLLAAGTPVWLRADNAYYCGALAAYCRERGWDYSISVTDARKKRPVLRIVAAMELGGGSVRGGAVVVQRPAEAAGVALHGDPDEPRRPAAAGGGAAASRQAGARERAEGSVDRTGLAPSAVQVLRGGPGILPVRADRAVAAGVGAHLSHFRPRPTRSIAEFGHFGPGTGSLECFSS